MVLPVLAMFYVPECCNGVVQSFWFGFGNVVMGKFVYGWGIVEFYLLLMWCQRN